MVLTNKEVRFRVRKTVEFDHPKLGVGYSKDGSYDGEPWIAYDQVFKYPIVDESDIPKRMAEVLYEIGLPGDVDDAYTFYGDGLICYCQTEDIDGMRCNDEEHDRGRQLYHAVYEIHVDILPYVFLAKAYALDDETMKSLFPAIDVSI